jgi:hypothetical protein
MERKGDGRRREEAKGWREEGGMNLADVSASAR